MATDPNGLYQELCAYFREIALLGSIGSLLGWDERTQLPPGERAGEFRAEQVSYLDGQIHRKRTDPRVGEWLNELAASPLASDPHSDTGTTIRELKRQYDRHVKLPQALVEELSRLTVRGQQVWVEARKHNQFSQFRPILERIIQLKREQAEALGYETNRYDALLEDYEPGARADEIAQVLGRLRDQLVPLVSAIADRKRRPNLEILQQHFPTQAQRELGTKAATAIGFDFERGRLDVTHHPFCTEAGPHDCRITTRYDEHYLPTSLFGTLHEAGHGIYEQGLRSDYYGLPPGSSVSLGIHESQSRMWENAVGRSRGFWEHFYPEAQRLFPQQLGSVPLDDFYFAINDVRPSLIRVEADEVTYNLHIIVRFELEQSLLSGDLAVADLPGAWNAKYGEYLGMEPDRDANGVLQDVHWSAALIGYFPTYSLGNLYAAQLFEAAQRQLGDLPGQFARGEFQPLRDWLRENIHRHGQCYRPAELIERISGRPLEHAPLVSQLRSKYGPLFGIQA